MSSNSENESQAFISTELPQAQIEESGNDQTQTTKHIVNDQGSDSSNAENSDDNTPLTKNEANLKRKQTKVNRPIPPLVDIDLGLEYEVVSPVRPRTRILSALGSLGRRGSDSLFQEPSRVPHRCSSNFDAGSGRTTPVSARTTPVATSQDYIESEPLLADTHAPRGAEASDPQVDGRSHQAQHKRTRPASACSVTEILGSPESPGYSINESDEDVTASTDSHCHSKIKRGGLDKKARTRLIVASVLCLMFMVGEMVGGLLAHSLAIVSDAAHLLTDFASFMISLMALYLANRPATKKLSFGWYRIEILGAFVSILMLWVLTGILVYSAVLRIMEDEYEIEATVMLITAGIGVAFNVVLGLTLHQHSHSHGGASHAHGASHHADKKTGNAAPNSHPRPRALSSSDIHSYGSFRDVDAEAANSNSTSHSDNGKEGHGHAHISSNINVKAAFIHVLGDLFQSVGVLIAAFIIYFKPEWKIADPICTFMFSIFVLVTTLTIMRDILVVLMEGTPRGINFSEVRNTFFEVEGVLDIHNLRVWSLTMDKIALSVHLAIDKQSDPHKVLKSASLAIQQKFHISETTMQIEEYVEDMVDCQDCQGPKL